MLFEEELRALLPDIDLIGIENALAFRILLATCVRGIELAKAKKEDVYLDRGQWWIPDESVKTRNGFLVPLVPAVVEWFQELIEMSGESDYNVGYSRGARHSAAPPINTLKYPNSSLSALYRNTSCCGFPSYPFATGRAFMSSAG